VFNAQPKDGGRFDPQVACPPMQQDAALVAAVKDKARGDDQQVASLVSSGARAVKRIYQDGDQHPSFKQTIHAQVGGSEGNRLVTPVAPGTSRVAEVSQPDALEHGPIDVPAEQARGLSRQALLAKATLLRQQESAALAAPASTPRPAAVPAPLPAAGARNVAGVPAGAAPATVAPPPSTATALVASEPARKQEPVFYQRWIGSLGNLTASVAGTGAEAPQVVDAPLPPKAPPRR
jgi:hypothetical protein